MPYCTNFMDEQMEARLTQWLPKVAELEVAELGQTGLWPLASWEKSTLPVLGHSGMIQHY